MTSIARTIERNLSQMLRDQQVQEEKAVKGLYVFYNRTAMKNICYYPNF